VENVAVIRIQASKQASKIEDNSCYQTSGQPDDQGWRFLDHHNVTMVVSSKDSAESTGDPLSLSCKIE